MIDDITNSKTNHSPNQYLVFPCEKCGKWTYAKITQKARKCGICNNNHFINTIKTFELADNVAKAAKLTQQKNVEWQAGKGITIKSTPCPSPKKPISNKITEQKSKFSFGKIHVKEITENERYLEILQKIKQNVIETQLPQPIPVGYFSILYEMYAHQFPSFTRFIRYGLNTNQISGDSFFGYSIVK